MDDIREIYRQQRHPFDRRRRTPSLLLGQAGRRPVTADLARETRTHLHLAAHARPAHLQPPLLRL